MFLENSSSNVWKENKNPGRVSLWDLNWIGDQNKTNLQGGWPVKKELADGTMKILAWEVSQKMVFYLQKQDKHLKHKNSNVYLDNKCVNCKR